MESNRTLADLQFKLLRIDSVEEVYRLLADGTKQLIGRGIVAAIRLDDADNSMRFVALAGLAEPLEKIISVLGMDPTKASKRLDVMSDIELGRYRSGKLESVQDGLFGILAGTVPKGACDIVQKMMGIRDLFTIGIVQGTMPLGGLVILAHDDLASIKTDIEHVVNQAAFIIQRKHAEEKLKETFERLNLATRAARLGIWDWDIEKNRLIWDDRMYELYGIRRTDFAGAYEAWLAGIHPEDRDASDRNSLLAQRGEREYDTEFRVVWPDGSVHHLKAYAVFDRDPDGKPLRMTGINYDITGQKQAENEVQESDARFRRITEGLTDYCYTVMIENGRVVGTTHGTACIAVTGYSAEEFKSDPYLWINMVPEQERGDVNERIQDILAGKEIAPLEHRIIRKDGAQRWVRDTAILHKDSSGKLISYDGVIKDVTEWKNTHEALCASELNYRTLADSGQALIWTSGTDKLCNYFNKVWLEFTGRTLEQELGNGWAEGVHPDDIQRCLAVFTTAFDKREPFSMDYRIRHNGGGYRWIQDDGCPRFDMHGNFIGYIGYCLDITERKQAEDELLKTTERLQLAQRAAKAGTWDWDIVSGQLEWSSHMFELLGLDSRKTTASFEVWKKVLHPKDAEAASLRIEEALKQKTLLNSDYRIVLPDGVIRWINATGQGRYDDMGQPIRMVGICMDITERKLAEEKIGDKDLEFRKLSANVPDLIFQFTRKPDGSYCVPIASEGIRNIFGCSPEDVLDDFGPISRVIYPEDAARVISDIEYSAKHLTYFTCEFRVQIPGRSIQWIYSRSAPEKLADGSVTWFGFNTDITERKLAQAALEESEKKYRGLFSEMKSGFTLQQMLFDAAGKPVDYCTIDMNPAAEKLLGFTKETVIGKPVGKLLPVEEFEKWLLIFSRVAVDGISTKYEMYSPFNSKHFEGHAFCPKPGQFAVMFDDVTGRKKTEEALQNTQKLESLGVLAGGIAHDFNNLMGGLFGYIDMAKEESRDEKVTRYLGKAMRTIDRAKGLTAQLLTFSKGGAPIMEIDSLFPFVKETAQFALSGSNVSCRFEVPDSLWPCNFDKNQIGQVIDNLVINAQQAMPGGGNIEITAQNIALGENEHPVLEKGMYVKLSVRDDGIGISKEIMPRIFDPFYTTKTKGHGLGLATCYSIVNRHGGVIEVESEQGKGATFHVYLPAVAGTASTPATASPLLHRGSGTILVMDDEEVMLETISDMLTSLGYTVVGKENGKDAVDFFAGEHKANRAISGMIFDLTVPGGMGGKEAVAEIRKLDTMVPVIVASGYADDPVMTNPKEFGFTASICKPFRKAELVKMLNENLQIKKE